MSRKRRMQSRGDGGGFTLGSRRYRAPDQMRAEEVKSENAVGAEPVPKRRQSAVCYR